MKLATPIAVLALAVALISADPAFARGHTGGHRAEQHSSREALGVSRNRHGRIARSSEAKDAFKRGQPCPSTGRSSGACPGYVIDHVNPLKRGGADKLANMQWQTKEAAKAKDMIE